MQIFRVLYLISIFVLVGLLLDNDIMIISIIFHRNCQIAFSLAETQLDIPSLLDIRDMQDSSQLDRRSILTYLSQYYHKFASQPSSLTTTRPHFSKTEINSSRSLPATLNSLNEDHFQLVDNLPSIYFV